MPGWTFTAKDTKKTRRTFQLGDSNESTWLPVTRQILIKRLVRHDRPFPTEISVCPGAGTRRQRGALFRVGQKLSDCVAELRVRVGNENVLTIGNIEALDGNGHRDTSFPGGKRPNNFTANPPPKPEWPANR